MSKKQIMRILDETQNDRDLALYHLLYEGALRPQEILSLSISDLSWTSQGVRVNVNGKTGNRQILVVECKDHLRRWMERHPLADQRNAPLWTDLNVDSDKKMEELRMNYDYFRIKLKRLSKKADVRTYQEKGKTRTEVYPYLYRHTRLTELARELSESSLKAYAGWTQGSDMAEVYVHLSGRDIDDQILSIYGLDEEDQGISTCCNKCDREVGGTASYCPRCGSPV
ncbi:MAG: tyrosine-type recombinase/integrase [Candidatus Nanosalina sp.]